MLYRIPGDLNEEDQRGSLFVIQGISTARIGEIVRGTTGISPGYTGRSPHPPLAADALDH
jgi:hypothetical protein